MEPKQALELVARACASINANLETHRQLLGALEVLSNYIEANTPKPEED